MDQCGMENKEKVPSSDCDKDEDEDFNLLTFVNEHSEVIRLIEDDKDTNLPILNCQNSVPDDNEIEIFHPPPVNPESDSDETNSCDDNQNVYENGNGKNSLPNDNEIEIFDPPPDNPESDSMTLMKMMLIVRKMWRKMKMTVKKMRNITWFTKKKIMTLRTIFISLKYQLAIMSMMLNAKKILEMVGNGLKKI